MLARLPLHPILFAAYAVLFLYAVNITEVRFTDVVVPLGQSLIAATAVLAGLALVLRDAVRGAIVASAAIVAFFGFGHVGPVLTDAGIDERAQLAIWALGATAVLAYASLARASLPRTTAVLNAFSMVLVLLAVVGIVPYEASRAGRTAQASTGDPIGSPTGATGGRDVYLLVFDRYGSRESIELRFGITDNDLYDWLEAKGFTVPAQSHANYRKTDFSLASTLNMTYLDELTKQVGRGSDDITPAREMFPEHAVGRGFRARGYRYYNLGSWFAPTASIPIADENLTFGAATEFESTLRDTTILPAIERVTGSGATGLTFRDRHREIALFQFRQLRRLAAIPGPKFVFAHVLLPHAPYVFRADGTIIPEEEARAADERDLYRGQLAFLNDRIKEVVEALLAGPDERDPIVILQADEGPFLCRNVDCPIDTREDMAIRFGILDALYLPGLDDDVVPETFTPVNTFRLVFREYFGADIELLPDRSFTWPDNEHLYDFRDVTDQLVE